jgi:preprotein translocase subunit SecY
MFKKMIDAFKVKDIRHRMGYVLLCLVIIRIGSQIPVPGVNSSYFKEWFSAQAGGAFNFFDAFTGGSFSSMSILALSITPYITSSIIIELLTIAIPALEEMQRDGEDGRKKMVAITRYLTVGLSLFESIAMTVGFGNQGLIPDMNFLKGTSVVVALTAGSCFLMWIGEQITEKGIGNGISMVLLINIVSRLPQDLTSLYEQFVKGQTIAKMALAIVIIAAIIILMVVLVCVLNGAERHIPVQYSRKTVGRRMVGQRKN